MVCKDFVVEQVSKTRYIDVFSRMQIEKLILQYQPTMLIVDHDVRFREKIATKVYEIEKGWTDR